MTAGIHGIALAAIGSLVLVGSVAAQTVTQRIERVRDGTVRMSFAAREGVCGWGNGTRIISGSSNSADWESDCDAGPVRVVLRKADGAVVDLDSYIGGRWRSRPSVVDLGDVPVREAAAYLIELAETLEGEVGKDAVFPAAVADSVIVWPDLARIARDASRPREIRKQAIFWIGQNSDDAAVEVLEDLLHSSSDREITEQSIFALSQHDSERSNRVLRDFAMSQHEPQELRKRAVFWLGQGGDGEAAEFLRDLYRETSELDLRERIIFSLSQMRDAGNERWLLALATDSNEPMELREKAIFWTGQMRQSTPDMVELYDRIADGRLRERLIFALSQKRRDPEAMDKLMQIVRDDPDRELRGKAIFWLGQSRDPRAIAFLAELISR